MKERFSQSDMEQMAALGISLEQVQRQITNFRNGFPKTELLGAATIANGGITRLSDADIARCINSYHVLGTSKRILKFVPASGAATRMFKSLFEFSAKYYGMDYSVYKDFPEVKEFIEHIRAFAFFEELEECMKKHGLDFGDSMDRGDFATIINFLLKEQYMDYGSKPKGMLKFHRYTVEENGRKVLLPRTPFEEHIVEATEYARNSDGHVYLHFTVSPEHRNLFQQKLKEVKRAYEQRYGVSINVTFSEQKHYTDTIAVDEYNEPLRDEHGRLTFRPGGHGALIENLNDMKADIIFIKNIDNVVPDWMKHTTTVYKEALAGLLLELQHKNFEYLESLEAKGIDEALLREAATFASRQLRITQPDDFNLLPAKERKSWLKKALNRPMRVCGMVRNQGEPGGGPFFTLSTTGERSLQIVETAQINTKNPEQNAILQNATHFNPVDLVCATKNYKGRRFNLHSYIDPATGFISKKSKGAVTLKSQELPGLWNGSMARWITIFVEVPLATFNPVKTVNDLLRKEHQEGI